MSLDESDPRLRLVHLEKNKGIAAALNAGIEAAQGEWVAHVDDDDELLPRMLEVSLQAIQNCSLARPVVALSGIEEVDGDGKCLRRLIPPTRPKGRHWSLEPLEEGCTYETRNTMVAPRQLLLEVGLYEERLRASARHELFLRLNPVATLLGLPDITYRRRRSGEQTLSTDVQLKHVSFTILEELHGDLFRAHPNRYAHYLRQDGRRLMHLGRTTDGLARFSRALRLDPQGTISQVWSWSKRRTSRRFRPTGSTDY